MACIVLALITHCYDDICGTEPELINSSRKAFLDLVSLLGLKLGMVNDSNLVQISFFGVYVCCFRRG